MKINTFPQQTLDIVYLGGPKNSLLRERFISFLDSEVPYYDPRVDEWSPADLEKQKLFLMKTSTFVYFFDAQDENLTLENGFEIGFLGEHFKERFFFIAPSSKNNSQLTNIKNYLNRLNCRVIDSIEEAAITINQKYENKSFSIQSF